MFRVSIITLVSILFVLSGLYFISNPSYQNSLQARINYFLHDYKSAYKYAKISLDDDKYNKMAFTILAQSKIAIEHEDYIKQGEVYLSKINAISRKKEVLSQDKSRIKFMCEIMIEDYKNLPLSKLTDNSLKQKAKETHDKFKQIYDALF